MFLFKAILTRTLHQLSYLFSLKDEKTFARACHDIKQTQTKVFRNIMLNIEGSESAIHHQLSIKTDLEHFRKQVPITDYDDWSALIKHQQNNHVNVLTNTLCHRYQPTSGSTSKIKWIPYNKSFLNELDNAISPWVADMYRTYPKIKSGKHYWSLSWVPSDLRNKLTSSINNDLQLLPWWKQLFMSGTMAVPESTSLAETSDESFFATSCYLVSCSDLSFISVWSPTFALSLLDFILQNKSDISVVLSTGIWPDKYPSLQTLNTPKNKQAAHTLDMWDGKIDSNFTASIWPNLALISAWDTSSSTIWAQKLKDLFPHSHFQGKGLWATEGVTSIPYMDQFPLAINSHFYEFEEIDSKKVFDSWQLTKNMIVRPIISSSNGLLRYGMKDQLKVTGFINQCPCFEFIGRMDGTDMVGEKLSTATAVQLLNEFNNESGITPITLIAIPASAQQQKPNYLLLCEKNKDAFEHLSDEQVRSKEALLEKSLEEKLSKHFHYQLARELGQLEKAKVSIKTDALALYANHKVEQGMVKGNIKVEPLVLWQNLSSSIILNTPESQTDHIKANDKHQEIHP